MLKFIPYVLKNLRGHRVRTLMTVGGAAVLMFLFAFVSSIQEGLRRLTDPTQQDSRLIVYQAFRFCPSTSQLLHPLYEEQIRQVPGVREVLPIKVVVNNCRASLDSVVFHGVPPERLREVRQLTLLGGSWEGFINRKNDGALVGRKIAERRQIAVGQPFTISGVTVFVEGIFASDQPGEENLIYTHLALLQPQGDVHHQDLTVTLYEVHLADPAQGESVAAAIDEKIRRKGYPIQTDTKPQKMHYQRALSDLVELIGFTQWLGFVCVGVVGVLVANSVIMAAQDRVKEHAVLQTIGYAGRRIFGLMLAESLLISVTGGLLGIVGCLVWLYLQGISVSTEGVSIDFLATPELAGWGLAIATAVGAFAGLVPAWQASRADIVSSLR